VARDLDRGRQGEATVRLRARGAEVDSWRGDSRVGGYPPGRPRRREPAHGRTDRGISLAQRREAGGPVAGPWGWGGCVALRGLARRRVRRAEHLIILFGNLQRPELYKDVGSRQHGPAHKRTGWDRGCGRGRARGLEHGDRDGGHRRGSDRRRDGREPSGPKERRLEGPEGGAGQQRRRRRERLRPRPYQLRRRRTRHARRGDDSGRGQQRHGDHRHELAGEGHGLNFLGPNSGSTRDAIEGVDYAVANGADSSNNLWGSDGGWECRGAGRYEWSTSTSSRTAPALLRSSSSSSFWRSSSRISSIPEAPSLSGTPTNRSSTPYSPCR
jgi:hypothetical protein